MKPYASYKPSGVAWLGDVPSHWASKRLKHIGQFRAGAGFPIEEQGQPDNSLPFFKVKDIDGSNQGGVITTADSTVSIETANRLGAKIFPKNSIVFAKVGAALLLNRFRLLGVDACVDNNMMGYMINADEAFPEFMYWAMQRINFSEIVNPGTVPSLNEPLISNLFMAIPPPDEQQAIADYLDAETARIDTLVQEKEELIGLLKEARSATITEAVSRGLCPSVPLKSSGLHFLGNVPKHWKKFKVAHAFGTSSGTTPPTDEPKWYEGDVPWVQSSELRENVVFSTEKKVTVEAVQKFSALKIYPAGTLLLAMYGATIGRVGLLGVPATTNQACCALHPLGEISTQFFCWWLQAYRDELVARGYGGGQPNISATLISGMYFFAPLPEEQQAIAEYLDDETAKIDALITHTQEEIALLKELRAATIADAVLGRVDVRSLTQKQ